VLVLLLLPDFRYDFLNSEAIADIGHRMRQVNFMS